MDQHWHSYVIEYQAELLQLPSLFAAEKPLIVEIGFGMGDSLLEMAMENTDANFIGIDVHRPGVGKLLHGIVESKLTNVKIVCHDAKEVLQHCFESDSIDRLLVFFPDPWPKQRHHKRRLIQPDFIDCVSQKLRPGGEIHLATDWQAYAEHMMEVLESNKGLSNAWGANSYWSTADRPVTKFERRGKKLGHSVWDLLYRKNQPDTEVSL